METAEAADGAALELVATVPTPGATTVPMLEAATAIPALELLAAAAEIEAA
jgi:hypothetical protein